MILRERFLFLLNFFIVNVLCETYDFQGGLGSFSKIRQMDGPENGRSIKNIYGPLYFGNRSEMTEYFKVHNLLKVNEPNDINETGVKNERLF